MKKLTRVIFIMFFLWTVVCGLWTNSYAEVPHLLNYQGRLTDSSGVPLNGSYAITFRIYDAESAGNMLWEETYAGVIIQKGIFSVLLGSATNLNLAFDKPYFLEIKVGSEVMSPRQRIASAAYAIRAEHGVPKGVIVMWSGKIADIPSGWALCDGTNGTPDLRDRFIVGASQDDNGIAKTNITGSLTQMGGSITISEVNLPSHSHGIGTLTVANSGEHVHNVYSPVGGYTYGPKGLSYGSQAADKISTLSGGAHSHGLSGSTAPVGSGVGYTQPYYALAYIMKL